MSTCAACGPRPDSGPAGGGGSREVVAVLLHRAHTARVPRPHTPRAASGRIRDIRI
jgi:hypothetical protein